MLLDICQRLGIKFCDDYSEFVCFAVWVSAIEIFFDV